MKNEELRELDAWIAEHVMGWKKALKMSLIEKRGQFVIQGDEIYIHDRGNYVKTFKPTTDPAAAMQVLEKCLTYGFNVEVFCYDGMTRFSAVTPCRKYHSEADTLPLAICLFAKKLFEKE